jgi:hypothetical protein
LLVVMGRRPRKTSMKRGTERQIYLSTGKPKGVVLYR